MNEALEAVELNFDDTSSDDSDSDADEAAWRCPPEKQKKKGAADAAVTQEQRLLRDLTKFQAGLDRCKLLRICCACGEERGAHLIPDTEYLADDPLLVAMNGELVRPDDSQPLRLCLRCVEPLEKNRRPPHALHFPPMDPRFAQLSRLEYQLIRPVVPVIKIFQLVGEGQLATIGSSVTYINDCVSVTRRLPRKLSDAEVLFVRQEAKTSAQITSLTKIRPQLLRTLLVELLREGHPAYQGIEIDEAVLAELAVSEDAASSVVLDVDGSAAPAAGTSDTSPDAAHVLMEAPDEPTVREMLQSLVPEQAGGADRGLAPSVTDFQPQFAGGHNALNEFETGRLFFAKVFPNHFTNGVGGLHLAEDSMKESAFVQHALHWHTRQFALDADFIFLAYHRMMRDRVSGLCLAAAEHGARFNTSAADAVTARPEMPSAGQLRAMARAALDGQGNAVSDAVGDVQKLLNRLMPFSQSLPCTEVYMANQRKRLLALISSGVLADNFTWFLTYGANDYNWPEVYDMIFKGPAPALSKKERRKLLADNPLIATTHYFDRERLLWKHIIQGEGKPLGPISEYWKRRDGFQRGSWHSHTLLATSLAGAIQDWLTDPAEGYARACELYGECASAWLPDVVDGFDEMGRELPDAAAGGSTPSADTTAPLPAESLVR
jgi:hypothetical protein